MQLGGSHFCTYNSGFPCVFICLSFMLMALDFSRTQKGYSVHVYNLYYIVIDLDQDQDSLLVKRRNDNHSPGPVIRELVPSSHQRSELSNTILCIFSR